MTFYDENGNIITLEISDNSAMLEALELQNENLEAIIENQAAALEASQERYEMLLAHTEAQEAKIAEMNQYTAYIFVIVLAFILYRILGGATLLNNGETEREIALKIGGIMSVIQIMSQPKQHKRPQPI